MILAVAFVPIADVSDVFDQLHDELPPELDVIADYFDDTYIKGKPARGRRQAVPPRYPIPTWNLYDATLRGLHRTNNISEGWHNRFRVVVMKDHPDLYSCIKEFQKEQGDVETTILEANLGRNPKAAPKKQWVQTQLRLQKIVLNYNNYKNNGEILNYLRNVSYNFHIQ